MVNPEKYHFKGKVFWVTPTDENTKGGEELPFSCFVARRVPAPLAHHLTTDSRGVWDAGEVTDADEHKDWADFTAMSG